MYTFEEHDYEAERVLNSLTQYTKSGNATWRITDYNPIGCLPADIVENKKDSPSLVCHTISAIGITPEGSWNVHIMESIYLSSGKGDIDLSLMTLQIPCFRLMAVTSMPIALLTTSLHTSRIRLSSRSPKSSFLSLWRPQHLFLTATPGMTLKAVL